MSREKNYMANDAFVSRANITSDEYNDLYRQSIEEPDIFWSQQAEKYISFSKKYNQVLDWSFQEGSLHTEWFKNGKIGRAHV